MYEYGIYIRCGTGIPYMIHIYKDLTSAKLKLYDMVSLDEERGRPFFVDNDFYENKHTFAGKLTYYSIKTRKVEEWQKFSSEIEKSNNEERNNKIIHFHEIVRN